MSAVLKTFQAEDPDGCMIRFCFVLDEETAARYGIKPIVVMRVGAAVPLPQAGMGWTAVYWDRAGGGEEEEYDGHHAEPWIVDAQPILDEPQRAVVSLLDWAFKKKREAVA